MLKYIILCYIFSFSCCISVYAQKELPDRSKQTQTKDTPRNEYQIAYPDHSIKLPDENPRPVVVVPGSDTLSLPIIRQYTLIPWLQYKPTLFTSLNMPYVMDYISITHLGKIQAMTNITSYPMWGSTQDVQFFYPYQLSSHLYLYGGAAAMKYNFGGLMQTDFGAAAGLYYSPFQKIGFNLYYQHSFRQDIIDLNPQLNPLLWQNRVGFDIEFKPNENVKFRIGIMKDTRSGTHNNY